MQGRVKYYFKKPKGAIVKDLLTWLALAGMVVIASQSPYFVSRLLEDWKHGKRYKEKSKMNAFQRMRKAGLIAVERRGSDYCISLTEKGKQKAGWLQIDALSVTIPKYWKKQWHFLLFDIVQVERWKRDVLRSFLERLGFALFQKSVWVYAHDCSAELEVLKEFIGLTSREIKHLIVDNHRLSQEDSQKLCLYFKVSQ